MKRLVLIDGNAIMHRAYHALPPLTDRSGRVVNAVYGFCTMLLKITLDLQPTHLAVTFDTEKPTFRHAAYVGYQSHRPRLESDLSGQFSIIQDLLGKFGIGVYFLPGYEADDVIGTIAKRVLEDRKSINPQASSLKKRSSIIHHPLSKIEVIIVTGDRDLLQLVNDRVKVYMPIKGLTQTQLFDTQGVEEYIGVKPSKIVDYKALIGDTSDNYPGILGVGPKTAVVLLNRYGTLEDIFEAIESKDTEGISPAVLDKLVHGHESGRLSKQLATIDTDVPITFDINETVVPQLANNPKVIEALKELGFKSLVARLGGKEDEKKSEPKKKKNEEQLNLV